MSGLPEQNDTVEPVADEADTSSVAEDRELSQQDDTASQQDDAGSPTESAAVEQTVDEPAATEPAVEEQSAAGEHAGGEIVEEADEGAVDDLLEDDEDEEFEDVDPIEEIAEDDEEEVIAMQWYILKIQVNRETSICAALERRVKVSGLERYFGEILVPTEDVREFTKSGKQRTVKRKLYPGYIVVRMALNEETWFLVRETPGIGDFTGAAGKPAPLSQAEVDRIIRASKPEEVGEEAEVKIGIKFKVGDRVRVKEGNFQNFEGEVETIDESNGRIVVIINIFNRPTPVEMEHWQVETLN